MKEKKLLQAMGLADEKFVEEASPNRAQNAKAVNKRRRKDMWWRAQVACFVGLAVAVSCWLFIPFNTAPPSVAQYADSEYYELIQKLNVYNYRAPEDKNNYEKYVKGFFELLGNFGMKGGNAMDFAPGMDAIEDEEVMEDVGANQSPTEGEGNYVEITDNQVDGVIEADLIKRTKTHIFYLDEGTLRAFTIAGEDSKEVGKINLNEISESSFTFTNEWEFYLSMDGKTAIVAAPYWSKVKEGGIAMISVDVSDPTNMNVTGRSCVTGGYKSSRLVDGNVLLITEFAAKPNDQLKYDEEATYVPQIETGEGTVSVPAENIIAPETLTSSRYTVVWKLDQTTLTVKDSAAFLSYSDQIYVSRDAVYATRTFSSEAKGQVGHKIRSSMTEISAISYTGELMEYEGSIILEGYVKNQYSLDEYENILRVVTTTNVSAWREYTNGSNISVDWVETPVGTGSGTNANLYCIDLNTWEIVAEVLQFAPQGEIVQSVRFDKEMAYVCTSVQLSDPVFFFDLSDLNNITVKDTGTIEGFSTSLINFGNGYLLGIGRGSSWDTVKVEVYEECADGVRSVSVYELENATYSTDYKSYYIDRENQLMGFGAYGYNGTSGRYILLMFDGYELRELVDVPLFGDVDNMRAAYIEEYLYMFGAGDFKVKKVGQE
ncbi:MAG: beta-propeller domain-containing protein [Lachnospiraceae bacterium]|nr:beta-propeller domain-containing protein [Lachnospiraceae bacterium]